MHLWAQNQQFDLGKISPIIVLLYHLFPLLFKIALNSDLFLIGLVVSATHVLYRISLFM